jgi:hypothetical protein
MNAKLNKCAALLILTLLIGSFFLVPQKVSALGCDAALLITHVTAPDGSAYSLNAVFTKVWRLKNVGTCTWTTAYKLAFVSGAQMGGPAELSLPVSVAPNATIDLSLTLTAPSLAGSYRGYWQLKNAAGVSFGTGAAANDPFWVDIVTRAGSAVTPTFIDDSYDFASSKAQRWSSGAGSLPFPGADGDTRGFSLKLNNVKLETGITVNQPSLLMVPQNKLDGYIQGMYPAIAIKSGDRFQATIGCQYGATACYTTYRIDARTSAGTKTLWTFTEKYDNQVYNVNLDLSSLAGKNVEFFLMVLAHGSPTGDRALWVAPRITRGLPTATASITVTPSLTVTTTPVTPVTPGTPVPTVSGYPFAVNGAAASWLSGAGALPFPGMDGDTRGFALKLQTFQMENGVFINETSLLMVPQYKTDGYVQALYPAILVQNGDRFQGTIGCLYGATSCYVTYRIDARTSAGTKTLWTFTEKYDNQVYNVNLDLSTLAGKNTEFFLLILASGSPTGDQAVWIAPRIVHAISPTPTATPTATAVPSNWQTYSNPLYQFQFRYPPEGQASTDRGGLVYIALPIQPGTNLTSKYLQVGAVESAASCSSLPVNPEPSEAVVFNGITFHKAVGRDQGLGQSYNWTNYYTIKGTTCISMGFLLHSGGLGAFPTETSEFNFAAESAVFSAIMNTFQWLNAP